MITIHPHPTCPSCTIFGAAACAELDERDRASLDRLHQRQSYRRNVAIFHEGDRSKGLYRIESGHVVLETVDPLGNDAILTLLGAGQTTGYRCFLTDNTHAVTARAVDAASVCFIPVEPIMNLIVSNSAFALSILQMVASDTKTNGSWFLRNPNYPVQTRILHFLILYKNDFSRALPDGTVTYQIPLRRREIAALLGARPETVIRAMSELNKVGIASFQGKTATVFDWHLLEKFYATKFDPSGRIDPANQHPRS